VIVVAVRWYLRYNLSYRDIEELLVERGVGLDHVAVYRVGAAVRTAAGRRGPVARHAPGDRWFVDETYVKVNGVWRYVYRAIDQHGQVIDVMLSAQCDADGGVDRPVGDLPIPDLDHDGVDEHRRVDLSGSSDRCESRPKGCACHGTRRTRCRWR
jgi:hypothetical protein